MGLDLHLFRVLPFSGDMDDSDNRFMTIEEGDENQICKTIRDKATTVNKTNRYYNIELMAKDNGLDPEKAFVSMIGMGQVGVSDGEKTAYILDDVVESKYVLEKVEPSLAFRLEEINYQRKGMDGQGYEMMENCHYCDDLEFVKSLVPHGLDKSFVDRWVEGETVFWAWR